MKPKLPAKLQPYSADIVAVLKSWRYCDVYFPGHGINAAGLAKHYMNVKQLWHCKARDIRKLIQYARLNEPEGNRIGGTPDDGYYFCLTWEELQPTLAHLIAEVATRNETIRKLKTAFQEQRQPELFEPTELQ